MPHLGAIFIRFHVWPRHRASSGDRSPSYHPSMLFPSASLSRTDIAFRKPRCRRLMGVCKGCSVLRDMRKGQLLVTVAAPRQACALSFRPRKHGYKTRLRNTVTKHGYETRLRNTVTKHDVCARHESG